MRRGKDGNFFIFKTQSQCLFSKKSEKLPLLKDYNKDLEEQYNS